MKLPGSSWPLAAGLGLWLVAGCAQPEPPASPESPSRTAKTARVQSPLRVKAIPAAAPNLRPPADDATAFPGAVGADNLTSVAGPAAHPQAVLAAMNAIRRATTEADRRRAVATFVGQANLSAHNPASVEMLLDALKLAPECDVVMAVQQVLGQSPDTAVPFMAALLYRDATTPTERERLLGVIRHAQTPAAVTMLTGLADGAAGHYTEPLALAAIDTLGVIGTPAAVRDLAGRIETAGAQGQNAQVLVEALSRTVNPAAFDWLAAAARGEGSVNTQVRLAALNALGNYPTTASREALHQIIAREADAALQTAAKSALKRASLELPEDFGKPATP